MRLLFATIAVAGTLWASPASPAAEFKLVLINPPPGGTSSGANDVNASGTVVGWFQSANGLRGFRWTPSTPAGDAGSAVTLGALPACQKSCAAEAARINASGQSVGYATGGDGQHRAVLWPASGTTPVDLGLLPGYTSAFATDVNDAGVVVGKSFGPTVPRVAFRWTPNVPNGSTGTLEALPGLATAIGSTARAINNAGDIVGESTLPAPGGTRAVRWSSAGPTDLDFGSVWHASRATAVNSITRVFGNVADVASVYRGYGFPGFPSGLGTWMGSLPGKAESEVFDINGPGLVVGKAYEGGDGNHPRAYLWTAADGMRDLNALIPPGSAELLVANGINDDRRIVGEASLGSSRAFLLIPWAFVTDMTRFVMVELRPYFEVCDPLRVCQTVRVTNIGARPMTGPLQIVLARFGAGLRLDNASGTYREAPFVSAAVPALAAGGAVDVPLIFDRMPNGAPPSYEIRVYAGTF